MQISSYPPPNKGFTLAEVLITLVVLGIVAAVTIPTLRNSLDRNQYRVPLKKAYSTMAEAMDQVLNTSTKSWQETPYSKFTDFTNELFAVLALNRVCYMGTHPTYKVPVNDNCFVKPRSPFANDTATLPIFEGNKYLYTTFELKDGTSVLITLFNEEDKDFASNVGTGTSIFGISGAHRKYLDGFLNTKSIDYYYAVLIDVNGIKEPNIAGQDVHAFVYTKSDGLIPAGSDISEKFCHSASSTSAANGNWNCTYSFMNSD